MSALFYLDPASHVGHSIFASDLLERNKARVVHSGGLHECPSTLCAPHRRPPQPSPDPLLPAPRPDRAWTGNPTRFDRGRARIDGGRPWLDGCGPASCAPTGWLGRSVGRWVGAHVRVAPKRRRLLLGLVPGRATRVRQHRHDRGRRDAGQCGPSRGRRHGDSDHQRQRPHLRAAHNRPGPLLGWEGRPARLRTL